MSSANPSAHLLSSSSGEASSSSEFGDAQHEKFYENGPAEADANGKTWYARGQNFIVAYSEAEPGSVFERVDQVDEYVVVAPHPKTSIEVTTPAESHVVGGFSLTVIPPGKSVVSVANGGPLLRIFSAESPDLAAKCSNADSYRHRHPNLPPYAAWPRPQGGFRVRSYSLDVPPQEGRVGRIFICTTLMINYANPRHGRSNGMLSPHSHDDFEQGTLVLGGTFTHHLRWPWTRKKAAWRNDEHDFCHAPSMSVAPARVIHTAEAMGEGVNQLLDVWSPPRVDYYKRGFVLNADDYQLP